MSTNRRQFIKATAAGAVAASLPLGAAAEGHESEWRPLEILVLGGTGFIGPHMVREALRRGHGVTLFNRGRTNNTLFPDLETIKGDRGGDLEGLQGRQWDVVIDNSGYVPRHVENSASLLADNVARSWKQIIYFQPGDEVVSESTTSGAVDIPEEFLGEFEFREDMELIRDERGVRIARESED